MAAYRDEQQSVAVASVQTPAEAEFLRMTLVAHGIAATVSPSDPAHPSLNYVQGIRVFVPAEEEQDARALLGGAG